jgi:hypothetical protein
VNSLATMFASRGVGRRWFHLAGQPSFPPGAGDWPASWPSARWTEREGQPRKRPAVRNGAAVKLAVLSGFLRAGGDPPHSVSLTEEGRSLLKQRGIA